MTISFATANFSAELLEEKAVPRGPCEDAGRPDEVPVVVGNADDEDEEVDDDDGFDDDDFDDDFDDDEESEDDPNEDEEQDEDDE